MNAKKKVTVPEAVEIFRQEGGVLRSGVAISLGINSRTLYSMRNKGIIVMLDRGLYCLASDDINLAHIDLMAVSKRLPRGVICLISALSFHELTTQIQRKVHVAYQQGWKQPMVSYPPIKIMRYSESSFSAGVQLHNLSGVNVKVYSAAKTVADCFKFRKYVGLDVAVEALKGYLLGSHGGSVDEVMKYSKICGVFNIITPYVEAIIHE